MNTFVKLRHPKTSGEWMCPADAVEAWLAKGWKKADPADAAANAATGRDK